jgi:hypothetical protein
VHLPNDEIGYVGEAMDLTTHALAQPYDGHMFAIIAKVHADPERRKHQFHHFLQMLNQQVGPREGEVFQEFFDQKLVLT